MRIDSLLFSLFLASLLALSGCPAGDDDDSAGDDDAADDDDDSLPLCADGAPVMAWGDAESDHGLYARAAEVTLETTDGPWNFKENWTGCDSYLFIQDKPKQTNGWDTPLWSRDVDTLLFNLPDNVHVFFTSNAESQAERDADLAGLQALVDEAIGDWTAEDQAHWAAHLHYLTGRATELPEWVGMHFYATNWGMGIDRYQRLRYIGSYADWTRYDQDKQWYEPNLSMAANEARHYNFEIARGYRQYQQDATVIEVLSGEQFQDPNWAGEKGYFTVELPDADTMAGFNKMEFDLRTACEGSGEYGSCPAWDRTVHLYLCDPQDAQACDVELGRWITTYHREGRWAHDVSAMLPLLRDGGTQNLAFYSLDPWEIHLSIRLYNDDDAPDPLETTYLFGGGGFNAEYNDKYDPISLQIPADATRVELATVISGHGMSMPGNCAEFCNTTHHFFVNGTENMRELMNTAVDGECMDLVSEGTTPNQYGTWWYTRAGWCPGKEVPLVSFDITDQVTPGAANEFDYEGLYNGAPYTGDSAHMSVASWLVVYR